MDRGDPVDVPRAHALQLALRERAARDHGRRRRRRCRARSRPGRRSLPTTLGSCDLVGEARMLELVGNELTGRIGEGIKAGRMSDQSAAVVRLYKGMTSSPLRHAGVRRRRWSGCRLRREQRGGQRGGRLPHAPDEAASAAAPPRWRATWSASACSVCPESARRTGTSRSATCRVAGRPVRRDRRRGTRADIGGVSLAYEVIGRGHALGDHTRRTLQQGHPGCP